MTKGGETVDNQTSVARDILAAAQHTDTGTPAGLAILDALLTYPTHLHAHRAIELAKIPKEALLRVCRHEEVMTSHVWFERTEAELLGRAMSASQDLGHNYVGARHLLLGIAVGEPGATTSPPFRSVGVDYGSVRRAVTRTFAAAGSPTLD